MVLQMAPRTSQIWGYADKLGDTITVDVPGTNTSTVATKVVHHDGLNKNVWKVMLPPIEGVRPT